MKSEMLYDFNGAVILVRGKEQLARIVCVPQTKDEKAFVGIITDDDTKIILDSDNSENDEMFELANKTAEPKEPELDTNITPLEPDIVTEGCEIPERRIRWRDGS